MTGKKREYKREPKSTKTNKINQGEERETINWFRILFLLLFAFILFIGYLKLSNWIYNNQLYPINYNPFVISTYQGYVKGSCFYMSDPVVNIDYKTNTVSISHYFEKHEENCNEKELASYGYPIYRVSELKKWKIHNPENLSYNYTVNLTERSLYLKINLSKMENYKSYSFMVVAYINPTFHTYYKISTEAASKIEKLNFNYNSDFLNGYTCDENCFMIYEGNIKKDFQIFKGFSKSWDLNSPFVYLRFNPQSNKWLFWLKILDVFILAISAVGVYDAIIMELFVKLLDRIKR